MLQILTFCDEFAPVHTFHHFLLRRFRGLATDKVHSEALFASGIIVVELDGVAMTVNAQAAVAM